MNFFDYLIKRRDTKSLPPSMIPADMPLMDKLVMRAQMPTALPDGVDLTPDQHDQLLVEYQNAMKAQQAQMKAMQKQNDFGGQLAGWTPKLTLGSR